MFSLAGIMDISISKPESGNALKRTVTVDLAANLDKELIIRIPQPQLIFQVMSNPFLFLSVVDSCKFALLL